MTVLDLSLIACAYLLGSVSSAIIVCRVMGLPDPRSTGSNNPGATNVLRIGGKRAAAITLLGDSIKGFVPTLLTLLLGRDNLVLALVGVAAFLGHLYPVFFGFKGGKGVATALGVQFGWSWMIGGAVAATWLFMAKVANISSLAALVSMALAPLYVWLLKPSIELVTAQLLITVLLIWRHRSNIRNLLSGSESGIKQRKNP
ncbi:MAG: glycerol-3-phosphate 1-O-acyltransferase PlsY [Gammaproteobacteria bacterium]|nr:glycerol-3-phosphate 1-O-acyltransferase PlsY [Gammaproteobacteria bacterium]